MLYSSLVPEKHAGETALPMPMKDGGVGFLDIRPPATSAAPLQETARSKKPAGRDLAKCALFPALRRSSRRRPVVLLLDRSVSVRGVTVTVAKDRKSESRIGAVVVVEW